MYAIVEDRGHQYQVKDGKRLLVDRLEAEVGSEIQLPVLLLAGEDQVRVGSPKVDGATVTCKVLAHVRGRKGIASHVRRRKHSRTRVGFRHNYTAIKVVGISG
jgi:large subunit ribosomal protein L21